MTDAEMIVFWSFASTVLVGVIWKGVLMLFNIYGQYFVLEWKC